MKSDMYSKHAEQDLVKDVWDTVGVPEDITFYR